MKQQRMKRLLLTDIIMMLLQIYRFILISVNLTNYESALAFSNNALEKFYNDISTASLPLSEENNITNKQTYIKKLENGLTEFNNVLKNKENPIKVMEIVHTQIHPNLQI